MDAGGQKNVTSGVIRRHFIAKEFRRVAIRIPGSRLFVLEAPLHHDFPTPLAN